MATGTMWGCGHITAAGLPACPVCEQIDDLRAEVERLRIECPACVSESAVAIRERDDARAERDRYQQVAMDRTRERNELKAEADQLRARVQQLGEELARWGHLGDLSRALKDTAAERDRYRVQEAQQRVERIKAEGEARRLRAGLSTIRTDYPDAAQAVNAILWPMEEATS